MNSQFHLLPRFWQWLWKVLQILCSPIVDKQSLHIIPWPTEAILIHNNHSLAPGCWKGREERAVSCWKGGVFGSLRAGEPPSGATSWENQVPPGGGHSQGSQEASSPFHLLLLFWSHLSFILQNKSTFRGIMGGLMGKGKHRSPGTPLCPAEDWHFTADGAVWGSGLPAWPACAY